MSKSGVSWYPTIFPDKCDGCGGLNIPKCIEFCSHNVFGIRDGKAIVKNPQNCVYGCISCEFICPKKAIAFPQRVMVVSRLRKSGSLLHKVKCKICGKDFWTNEDRNLCFDCEAKGNK